MDWWILLAVVLYFVSAMLIVAEVFVPSGGLIGMAALGAVVGAVAIFFNHSIVAGWIGIAIGIVMIPAVVIVAYRIFPKTRFGKNAILSPPKREKGDAIVDSDMLAKMIGKKAIVLSPLRPVGLCEIDGQRIGCIAENGYIEKNCTVVVIQVSAAQLVVRRDENMN